MGFKQFLESSSTAHLRYGSKFLPVDGISDATTAVDDLEDDDSKTNKAIIAVLRKMLGQGNSLEIELKTVKLRKPYHFGEPSRCAELVYHVETADLDGEAPFDAGCTLEF